MIRSATIQDLDYFYELYMHPEVNPYLLYDPMTKEEFEPIFLELQGQGLIYVYFNGENAVGMFKLVPQMYRTTHIVYLGGLAIHPNYSGKGLGLSMMQEILEFCKQSGFKRIELSTGTHNHKAIQLYTKVGFEQEGVLRKYTYFKSENRYLDEVLMSYIFFD
jgi:RimJ/RimL family protein N-acetyltransferase